MALDNSSRAILFFLCLYLAKSDGFSPPLCYPQTQKVNTKLESSVPQRLQDFWIRLFFGKDNMASIAIHGNGLTILSRM